VGHDRCRACGKRLRHRDPEVLAARGQDEEQRLRHEAELRRPVHLADKLDPRTLELGGERLELGAVAGLPVVAGVITRDLDVPRRKAVGDPSPGLEQIGNALHRMQTPEVEQRARALGGEDRRVGQIDAVGSQCDGLAEPPVPDVVGLRLRGRVEATRAFERPFLKQRPEDALGHGTPGERIGRKRPTRRLDDRHLVACSGLGRRDGVQLPHAVVVKDVDRVLATAIVERTRKPRARAKPRGTRPEREALDVCHRRLLRAPSDRQDLGVAAGRAQRLHQAADRVRRPTRFECDGGDDLHYAHAEHGYRLVGCARLRRSANIRDVIIAKWHRRAAKDPQVGGSRAEHQSRW